ncbi:MAG: phytanoyl-CoA dioxygenase family protein [Hyphomicrobiaceae bacterium]
MLSQQEIDTYNKDGYLLVKDAVSPTQLDAMREATRKLMDQSRTITESDYRFDLDEGHGPDAPRLTRIKLPHKLDRVYWDILQNSKMTEVLTTLLGPNTMLQTTKLNTKAPGGGQAVEWHQDWAFYPHTNDTMLAFGLMLEDVDEANGPLQVIPGSHKGPVLAHSNEDGVFCGAVDPSDPDFDYGKAVTLTGKAGDMTVHHVRMLHGSSPNNSDRNRYILFYECRAADAWPLFGSAATIGMAAMGQQKIWDEMQETVITGEFMEIPRCEAVPVRLPLPPAPDAGSIFKTQKTGGAKSVYAAE